MKKIDKFTKGEMSETQEEKYVESLYEKHYDNKLKQLYKEKLAQEHNFDIDSNDIPAAPKKNTTFKYIVLGASAIAAILAFVLVFLPMMNSSTSTNAQQYAQSLITMEEMDVKRGGQADSEIRLELVKAYNSGDYEAALELFDQLNPLSAEDTYFKGRVFLFLKRYGEAISTFKEINQPFKFSEELKYWLGVAYASNGDFANAKPLLQDVAKSKWKLEEAKAMLDKMK